MFQWHGCYKLFYSIHFHLDLLDKSILFVQDTLLIWIITTTSWAFNPTILNLLDEDVIILLIIMDAVLVDVITIFPCDERIMSDSYFCFTWFYKSFPFIRVSPIPYFQCQQWWLNFQSIQYSIILLQWKVICAGCFTNSSLPKTTRHSLKWKGWSSWKANVKWLIVLASVFADEHQNLFWLLTMGMIKKILTFPITSY